MANGHIYKRGNKWYARVDLTPDPVTGKRRQKRFSGRIKKEVENEVARTIADISVGGFGEANAKKLTVTEYLNGWLPSVESTIRPSSYRRYAEVVRLHFEPTIGRIQLAKLSPSDVQRLYANRLAKGLSPTTVAFLHNVLHKALKQAVRWGLLMRNVTEAVDPPREATSQYATWNERQAMEFLRVSDQDEFAALWRLALLTGMRRGEILGLKWEDTDLSRGTLSVKRTLSRGSGGKYSFGMPKTAAGKRSVALPRSVVASLCNHLTKQNEAKRKMGIAYQDQGGCKVRHKAGISK